MSQDNPSQSDANRVLRALNGERLKFTVVVYHKDGRKTEWQTNYLPDLFWNDNLRSYCIREKASKESYDHYEVMKWNEGDIIRVEDNNPEEKK